MSNISYDQRKLESALKWLESGWARYLSNGWIKKYHEAEQDRAGVDYVICVKHGKTHFWYCKNTHKIFNSKTGKYLQGEEVLSLASECGWSDYSEDQFNRDKIEAKEFSATVDRIWKD